VDPGRPLSTATFAALARRIATAPPRLGPTRLVCIDGPAGSGKTTFAGHLAAALEDATALRNATALVHLEDLYAGWTLTGAVARLSAGVLRPLSEGRPGAYHRYDWTAGRFAPEPVVVAPAAVLVVEGCGSSPRTLDRCTTLRIWVEAPPVLRITRGLERDGAALAPQWRRWQRTEAAEFAAEGTRARADLRVDGALTPDLPEGTFTTAG
jgi:uridine kinase